MVGWKFLILLANPRDFNGWAYELIGLWAKEGEEKKTTEALRHGEEGKRSRGARRRGSEGEGKIEPRINTDGHGSEGNHGKV